MTFTLTPLVLIQLFGAVITSTLAFYVYRRRDRPGATWLLLLLLGNTIWMATAGINYASSSYSISRGMLQLRYIGIPVIPIALLFFALAYTGMDNAMKPWHRVGIALPAVAISILAVTDHLHGLFYAHITPAATPQHVTFEFSVLTTPWLVYAFFLTMMAILVFLRYAMRTEAIYRRQALVLAGAVVIAVLSDLLFFTPLPPNEISVAPLGIMVTGIITVVAVYYHEFFSLIPATRELGRDELVARMDLGMLLVGYDGQIADVNPAAARIVGRQRGELVGLPVSDVLPELDALLAAGDTVSELELTVDGTRRQFEARTDSLDDDESGPILITLRDVTRRNRQQRRIDVLQRLLRHNLRTEMQVIMAYGRNIQDDSADPRIREQAGTIVDVASDLSAMSDEIRTLESHLDESVGDAQSTDPTEVAMAVVETTRETWPAANVELHSEDDYLVQAGDGLGTVLRIIVENAIEHNDTENPEVEVRIEPDMEQPDRWIRIAVLDNGPGIPESERQVVTGDESITPLQHGSGLGLWVVVWLVEAWGGSVSISDNQPRGSVVSCRLHRGTLD